MNKKLLRFLESCDMLPDTIDIEAQARNFKTELENALKGKESSLSALSSGLFLPDEAPRNMGSIAVDVGGTNLRIAEVSFGKSRSAEITSYENYPIAEVLKDGDAGAFFDFIAEKIGGAVCSNAGICFSYKAEILPCRDAKIIEFSKELNVKNACGKLIGEEINASLKRIGAPAKKITVLNDTTAALLGANSKIRRPFDTAVGMIVGTGMNCCCIERGEIINTESGCYNGFPKGTLDAELDGASSNPGSHEAEKLISGKYVNRLTDMLCEKFGEAIRKDAETVLFDRAARCAVSELLGFYLHAGAGESLPSYIAAEGSIFSNVKAFRDSFVKYHDEYIVKNFGIDSHIISSGHPTLIGAALAALKS